ncbi:TetR/AcrR family transcriptional regulator C-terminal domain-containing protein [Streptomyces sp. 8L]|uniref:TetR/AcrR family transcriptional regulator C-terminal domain-containing protein n=1 Tax=unclassified Streptomyces TaxID=2593676 RepID=UPI001CD4C400|nr:TetR/AcrR family transcriptional regulator C-terminal domain-containing protein [Streptomyces sp. 8L]MCA1224376.1 TetR/AcrR family transcriptional regulator C-terminal domain-containing protein [Streptomyces sp. 8L]
MRLRRSDVLERAMRLLEEEGLAGLTMRRLASALDVRPSALYWHFADKRALLDAMAEELVSGVPQPDASLPWDERATALATGLRDALRSHRDGARLQAGTFVDGAHTLRVGNGLLGAFADAGLTRAQATGTVFTTLHFVLGHTIEEQARDELLAGGRWNPERAVEAAADFPELASGLAEFEATPPDTRFAEGLGGILDGVRWRVARGASAGT